MMPKLTEVENYNYDERARRNTLPGCGHRFGLYIASSFSVDVGGCIWLPGQLTAYCNHGSCDQRFWFYPRSGRVTRRNTGETLSERRARLGHV